MKNKRLTYTISGTILYGLIGAIIGFIFSVLGWVGTSVIPAVAGGFLGYRMAKDSEGFSREEMEKMEEELRNMDTDSNLH